MNQQIQISSEMIRIIRMENPTINSMFTKAEKISRQRATVDRWIQDLSAKKRSLEKAETKAFSKAIQLITPRA